MLKTVNTDFKMGPTYAKLFVRYNKHQFFKQLNSPKSELYHRYVDNCIISFLEL